MAFREGISLVNLYYVSLSRSEICQARREREKCPYAGVQIDAGLPATLLNACALRETFMERVAAGRPGTITKLPQQEMLK